MPSFNLDDLSFVRRRDPSDMLGAVCGLPAQIAEASAFTRDQGVRLQREGLQHLVITGLGGSAVGGDLLRSYAADKCPVPIVVNRHYELPSFVSPATCVIAVSYSGNTEETLAAYDQAMSRGAQVIAVTSGGELAQRAERDGVPCVKVPGGLQPRAALGYLFVPCLTLLAEAGLLPSVAEDLREAYEVLQAMRDDYGPEKRTERNFAKQLAVRLHGKIPVVHSAAGLTETASYRWKTQVNENAQALCYAHVYPELNHNEVVGFDVPQELVEQVEVVTLLSDRNHPQIGKRMRITREELLGSVRGCDLEVWAQGNSDLSQLLSLIYIGDFASTYLALCYGLDPTPVQKIEHLKRRLQAE